MNPAEPESYYKQIVHRLAMESGLCLEYKRHELTKFGLSIIIFDWSNLRWLTYSIG